MVCYFFIICLILGIQISIIEIQQKVNLFISYIEKKNYTNFKKRPPTYDNKLNNTVITVLPYAAILHLLIGNF